MCVVVIGKPFTKNFRETIGRLFRRLFRVYAHLYSNHFDHICALGIEGQSGAWQRAIVVEMRAHSMGGFALTAHLNTSYRHFFLFVNEVRQQWVSWSLQRD